MSTTHPPVGNPLPAQFLQRLAELETAYLRETVAGQPETARFAWIDA